MTVLILMLLLSLTWAYPDGAPRRVCKRLPPGHEDIDYIRSQTGAVLEADKLSPGKYRVRIKATQPFRGICTNYKSLIRDVKFCRWSRE